MSERAHRTYPGGGRDGVAGGHSFCDFHQFACPPRLMIVHSDGGGGAGAVGPPAVSVVVLEVRQGDHAEEVAAWVSEVLAREAAQRVEVPVRVYQHDRHGNVHSWFPRAPHRLARERLAQAAPQPREPR